MEEHFTGRVLETLEVREGCSGLMTKKEFTGEAAIVIYFETTL
jgi:hypothetical protein